MKSFEKHWTNGQTYQTNIAHLLNSDETAFKKDWKASKRIERHWQTIETHNKQHGTNIEKHRQRLEHHRQIIGTNSTSMTKSWKMSNTHRTHIQQFVEKHRTSIEQALENSWEAMTKYWNWIEKHLRNFFQDVQGEAFSSEAELAEEPPPQPLPNK